MNWLASSAINVDRTFTDSASCKDIHRPHLAALLSFVRDGDTVIVHSMDRLARNLDDLRRTVRELTDRGVHVQFIKEQLTFTGDDTAMANLLLSVMGAFAEFEQALIGELHEGIALAKQRGAYRGRKRSLTQEQVSRIRKQAAEGAAKATLAREFGISRGVAVGVAGAGVGPDAEPGRCTARAGVPLANGARQSLREVVAARSEGAHAEFERARPAPAVHLLIETNKSLVADRGKSAAVGLVQRQPEREAVEDLRGVTRIPVVRSSAG